MQNKNLQHTRDTAAGQKAYKSANSSQFNLGSCGSSVGAVQSKSSILGEWQVRLSQGAVSGWLSPLKMRQSASYVSSLLVDEVCLQATH